MEIFVMILVGVAFLAACFLVIFEGRKNASQGQSADNTLKKKKPLTTLFKKNGEGAETVSKTAEDIVFSKRKTIDDNQQKSTEETESADSKSSEVNEPVVVATSIADFNDDSVIYDVMAQMSDFGHVYNQNLFLPTKDGDVQLLNHVSLAPTGFYLFTFLNVGKTYIIGTEDSKWWTRFSAPEIKDYLDNPVLRVDKEVKLLKTFFPKTVDSDYHTYIVLNNSCEIRDIELRENGNVRVLNADELKDVLINDTQTHDQVFDEKAMTQMLRVIDAIKSDENLTGRLSTLKDDLRAEQAGKEVEEQSDNKTLKTEQSTTTKALEAELPADAPEGKFTPSELNLRNALFVWRGQEMSVRPTNDNLLIDDDMIDAIVEKKPQSIEELYGIDGLSDDLIKRYGQTIVSMTSHTP